MDRIRVLQLGEENWIETHPIPEFLNWIYQEDISGLQGETYDLVFLDRNLKPEEVEPLFWAVRAYCLFVTDRVICTEETMRMMKRRKGSVIPYDGVETFLWQNGKNFFSGKRNREKPLLKEIGIAQGFDGSVRWNGVYDVELEGGFGENYKQVVFWRNHVPIQSNRSVDLWLEYEKDPQVSIQLQVKQFAKGEEGELQQQWILEEGQMQDILCLEDTLSSGVLFFSLMASGNGKLRIRQLHCRNSRQGFGHFLPGGERFATARREEIFCYFDPGDLKPPLNVFFSDRKKEEGFEEHRLMRKLGCPFLLITETRLGSGVGYLGSKEYEALITTAIQKYVKELGFTSKDLVFSGISMGAFGAMYYGSRFSPHAIVAGKPLANLGDVAMNERLKRPDGFPMSLELLKLHTGGLDETGAKALNQRFWNRFEEGDWSDTQFVIAYMLEDDFDPYAYKGLLEHLDSDGASVFGKGIHGRHQDNAKEVMSWFENQYWKLLERDYGRSK